MSHNEPKLQNIEAMSKQKWWRREEFQAQQRLSYINQWAWPSNSCHGAHGLLKLEELPRTSARMPPLVPVPGCWWKTNPINAPHLVLPKKKKKNFFFPPELACLHLLLMTPPPVYFTIFFLCGKMGACSFLLLMLCIVNNGFSGNEYWIREFLKAPVNKLVPAITVLGCNIFFSLALSKLNKWCHVS